MQIICHFMPSTWNKVSSFNKVVLNEVARIFEVVCIVVEISIILRYHCI